MVSLLTIIEYRVVLMCMYGIGPVFRTEDLMNLFRNAVIPSSGRSKSPPPHISPRNGTFSLSFHPSYTNRSLRQVVVAPLQIMDPIKVLEVVVWDGVFSILI